MNKVYALYKGEEIITIGTAKEIAKERGIKEATVYFLATKINLERAKHKTNRSRGRQICIPLDDEDEL